MCAFESSSVCREFGCIQHAEVRFRCTLKRRASAVCRRSASLTLTRDVVVSLRLERVRRLSWSSASSSVHTEPQNGTPHRVSSISFADFRALVGLLARCHWQWCYSSETRSSQTLDIADPTMAQRGSMLGMFRQCHLSRAEFKTSPTVSRPPVRNKTPSRSRASGSLTHAGP